MTKKLLKNSFIYILGDVLNKAVPFFMLPILTRYLTPEDYGIIATFTVLVSILMVFTGLSIHGSISVNFFKMEKEELKIFIGNCLLILNISTVFIIILVLFFHPIIIDRISLSLDWIIIAVIMAFAQLLTTINLLLWINEEQPKPYTLYQLSQTFVVAILSITLVVGFGMNWEGHLIATVTGTILFSIISVVFILKRGYLILKPKSIYIKDALKFGIPLIPHSLANFVKTGSDRLIVMSVLGASATGIYAVGFQIGMIMSVVVTAFHKVWNPYLFKVLSSNPSFYEKKKIVLFTYLYFVGVFILALILEHTISYMLPLLLGEEFVDSSNLILYFFLAFSFDGMYYMVVSYIFYEKKTHILAYISFASAILHIILIYLFLNQFGIIGVAQASVVSYFVTFIATWLLSTRIYQMPWKFWSNHENRY